MQHTIVSKGGKEEVKSLVEILMSMDIAFCVDQYTDFCDEGWRVEWEASDEALCGELCKLCPEW